MQNKSAKSYEFVLRAVFILGGMFTLLNGIFIWMTSNFNLGNILVFCLSALFLALGLFGAELSKILPVPIKIAFVVLLMLYFALSVFIMLYGSFDNADYSEDAVIVLGAGIRGDRPTRVLARRLDKAVEYHCKNPDALIVVSGGQGLQEDVPEAEVMEMYLISKGVNPKVILKENKSASTFENFTFSKEILAAVFESGYDAVFITNEFHILRAKCIAEKTGYSDITHLHSDTEWYSVLPCVLRECFAIAKFAFFGN